MASEVRSGVFGKGVTMITDLDGETPRYFVIVEDENAPPAVLGKHELSKQELVAIGWAPTTGYVATVGEAVRQLIWARFGLKYEVGQSVDETSIK